MKLAESLCKRAVEEAGGDGVAGSPSSLLDGYDPKWREKIPWIRACRLSSSRVALFKDGVLARGKRSRDRLQLLKSSPAAGMEHLTDISSKANVIGGGLYWACGAVSRPFCALPMPLLAPSLLASGTQGGVSSSAVVGATRRPPGPSNAADVHRSADLSMYGSAGRSFEQRLPAAPAHLWRSSLPFFPGEEDDGGEGGVWTGNPLSSVCVCCAWSDAACTCGAATSTLTSAVSALRIPLPAQSNGASAAVGSASHRGCIVVSINDMSASAVDDKTELLETGPPGTTRLQDDDGMRTTHSRRFSASAVMGPRQAAMKQRYQYWRKHLPAPLVQAASFASPVAALIAG